jgi:hypothetical protein
MRMWPSLPAANKIADIANFVLIGSLAFGVASTATIWWITGVKERYWNVDRQQSVGKIAELNTEAARLSGEAEAARAAIAEADAKAATANQRAAEANRKAEEERLARLKIEARLAWRLLTPEQGANITTRMRQYAGQPFAVVTYRLDDPEASNLGASIQQSLEAAGWKYSLSRPLDWLDTGVSVELAESQAPKLGPIARDLVAALNAEGLATKQVHTDKYEKYPDTIFIIVGKKPPTSIDLPGRGLP